MAWRRQRPLKVCALQKVKPEREICCNPLNQLEVFCCYGKTQNKLVDAKLTPIIRSDGMRVELFEILAGMSSEDLILAEAMTGCFSCRLFGTCETARQFLAKPSAASADLRTYLPRSERRRR
jgi:hypothetical protein